MSFGGAALSKPFWKPFLEHLRISIGTYPVPGLRKLKTPLAGCQTIPEHKLSDKQISNMIIISMIVYELVTITSKWTDFPSQKDVDTKTGAFEPSD